MTLKLFSINSIRTKILLGYVFLVGLIAIFIYTYYPNEYKKRTLQDIKIKVADLNKMMSTGVGMGLGELDIVAISEVMDWVKKDSALAYIIVLDVEGNEIISFNATGKKLNKDQFRSNSATFEANKILHSKALLAYQGQTYGTLLSGYSLEKIYEDIAAQRRTTLFICLGIFLLGVLLSLTISSRVTGNILRLNEAVNALSRGNTRAEVEISGSDESAKLAKAFNLMLNSLDRSQKELLASKHYTENVISSMLDSLFIVDKEGIITNINQAASELLEYDRDELVGRPMKSFLVDKGFSTKVKDTLFNRGRLQNEESSFVTKSGKIIPVLYSAANIYDEANNTQSYVCVAQNISVIKKAQENLENYSKKLEKSNRELDQFAYVVSHDLKAPLRAIYNLSQWIEEDIEDKLSEENKNQMTMLRGRVNRLESLINGILEYGKIGKSEVEEDLVDVNLLLHDILDLLAPPTTFEIKIGNNMPVFRTAGTRLHQVFANLIDNALKHHDKASGEVEISVTEDDSFYTFSVRDNGPGIEPQYHDKIFVIFQTLEARDKVESTGVGLSLTKKILEEKGCKIWLESEINKGSKFFFTWPK